MDNDLISREALKKHKFPINIADGVEIKEIEVVPVGAIDNAPTVEINLVKVVEEHEKIGFKKGFNEGYAQAVTESENKHEKPQGEWIPVSERLPEGRIDPNINDFEYVLCSTTWDDVRPYRFGKRIGEKKAHFWLGGAIMDKYITAWQPFPESYKKGGVE